MNFDYYAVLGGLSLVVGVISYIPYFRDVFRGTTKPHPFSWFIWGVLDTAVFIAQLVRGAGAGAWATGFTALATFAVSALALKRGEKGITRLDWVCLVGGLSGIALWVMTEDPVYAVLLATIVNVVGMIPTIRKSYVRPHEETASLYALSIVKWIPAILALESWNLTTWLFPVSLLVVNSLFVAMLLIRRRQLTQVHIS